jgi:hypothetical protein
VEVRERPPERRDPAPRAIRERPVRHLVEIGQVAVVDDLDEAADERAVVLRVAQD